MSEVLYIPYAELQIPPSDAFPQGEKRDYPLVKTALYYEGGAPPFIFYSVIDSGADHCMFPAVYGRQAGIPVETGKKAQTFGATGAGETYYHRVHVGVEVQGRPYGFDCYAGFMEGLEGLGVGLLGRCGFFDLFQKVAFDTSKRVVELTLRE